MQRHTPTAREGAGFGIVGMLGSLIALIIASPIAEVKPFVETVADGVLLVVPVDVFSWLKTTLGDQAKTWLLIGILFGSLALGAILGAWIGRSADTWRNRVQHAAIILFLLAVGVMWLVDEPELRRNFLSNVSVLTIASIIYAVVVFSLMRLRENLDEESRSRRRLLTAMTVAAGSLMIGTEVWSTWRRQRGTSGDPEPAAFTPAITPIDSFYRISKNFNDPGNTRGLDWSIEIGGLVDEPRAWNQADLETLGVGTDISTMLCISYEVGGDLIGTAEWTGVPMATLLDAVGAHGEYVWFTGADGYETSVPMERCKHPQAWVVWGMNGEPLPERHGAPVRAIIPGLYGMKSVKWMTGMDVRSSNDHGYWEQRGWTNEAVVKPMSRIDHPRRSTNLEEGPVPIRGIAFGGDANVERVEISTDDGQTWHEARMTEDPNPDGVAWSLWQYDWQAVAGTHTLVVRMIGTNGEQQTNETASPIPDGASGWHHVTVAVNRAPA